jgi:hypothetical protein
MGLTHIPLDKPYDNRGYIKGLFLEIRTNINRIREP